MRLRHDRIVVARRSGRQWWSTAGGVSGNSLWRWRWRRWRIELGAEGTLTVAVTGQVLANGGDANDDPGVPGTGVGGGGGGAGGGIVIHATNVNQNGLLSANGGDGGRLRATAEVAVAVQFSSPTVLAALSITPAEHKV